MAHAPSLARHVKAAGILERQECTPVDDLPGLWHVTDSGTGSGRIHVTSTSRCDCPDHNFRGNVCKHITAVQRAEAELVAYATCWDTKAATQQAYTVARATGATEQRAYADALRDSKTITYPGVLLEYSGYRQTIWQAQGAV